MHGSFSRADTMNFMAAIGPDFKAGFVDEAPVSNADIGKTMAHILGLKIPFKGALMGRVAEEALPGGASPVVENFIERSKPGHDGLAHRPGRPARRRERAISTPPGSPAAPSAWTSARRPAADAWKGPAEYLFPSGRTATKLYAASCGRTAWLFLFAPCPIPPRRGRLY